MTGKKLMIMLATYSYFKVIQVLSFAAPERKVFSFPKLLYQTTEFHSFPFSALTELASRRKVLKCPGRSPQDLHATFFSRTGWGSTTHLQIFLSGLQAHSLAAVIYCHFISVPWGQQRHLFSLQHHVLTNKILSSFPEKFKKPQTPALPVKDLPEGRKKQYFKKHKYIFLRKNTYSCFCWKQGCL